MGKTSQAQLQAVARYDRKNTKGVHVKLNINTDADIIAALENSENKQGFIKAAIREYMNRPR